MGTVPDDSHEHVKDCTFGGDPIDPAPGRSGKKEKSEAVDSKFD